ncbi:hypothetical protein NOVO_05745 [Rickettsiales bacterium Ac37b]|nr:hypothetical protein NOVO_05745 [Rickettsiales bacterium Ac37b]
MNKKNYILILQEPTLYRILICSNNLYLQSVDKLSELENLKSSCQTTNANSIPINFSTPLNIEHIIFHDYNYNILTNKSVSCINFKTDNKEIINNLTQDQLTIVNTKIIELYNTICVPNVSGICENRDYNLQIYIKLYELLHNFCNASYITTPRISNDSNDYLRVIKKDINLQYKIFKCDNISVYDTVNMPSNKVQKFITSLENICSQPSHIKSWTSDFFQSMDTLIIDEYINYTRYNFIYNNVENETYFSDYNHEKGIFAQTPHVHLGSHSIIFSTDKLYKNLYNYNSTAEAETTNKLIYNLIKSIYSRNGHYDINERIQEIFYYNSIKFTPLEFPLEITESMSNIPEDNINDSNTSTESHYIPNNYLALFSIGLLGGIVGAASYTYGNKILISMLSLIGLYSHAPNEENYELCRLET